MENSFTEAETSENPHNDISKENKIPSLDSKRIEEVDAVNKNGIENQQDAIQLIDESTINETNTIVEQNHSSHVGHTYEQESTINHENKTKRKSKKKIKKKQKEMIIESLNKKIFGDSDEEDNNEKFPFEKSIGELSSFGANHEEEPEEKGKSEKDEDLELELDEMKKKKKRNREKGLAKEKRSSRKRSRKKLTSEDLKEDKKYQEEKRHSENSEQEQGSPEEEEEAEEPLPAIRVLSEADKVLEKIKQRRSRKKDDSEDIEKNVEMIHRFISHMEQAANDDIGANRAHQPALNKLKMFSEVQLTLSKKSLQRLFIDERGLEAMRKWLEPLPDGSIPNLSIRTWLIEILKQFPPIDVEELRASGIGKVVMFLWKHKNETMPNKKNLKELIDTWSRPIFGLSNSYREYHGNQEDEQERIAHERRESSTSMSALQRSELELEKKDKRIKENRTHATIPPKLAMDYKVMPKSDMIDIDRNKKLIPSKYEELAKKIQNAKKSPKGRHMRSNKLVQMSIEGKNLYV